MDRNHAVGQVPGSVDIGPLRKRTVVPVDPLLVTELLGFQTFRRESRRPWTKEEDNVLMLVINTMYPELPDADLMKWDEIAAQFLDVRKPKDCRKRWCNLLDPQLRKGKWTPEEDALLISAYTLHGPAWKKVATDIPGRTDDQCAKRYLEVLDPNTKDRLRPWSHAEDLLLIQQIKIHGTKWKTIANHLEGRPSLTCRNRWRKIVTDVVRGKAAKEIRREVEAAQAAAKVNLLLGSIEVSDDLSNSSTRRRDLDFKNENGITSGGHHNQVEDRNAEFVDGTAAPYRQPIASLNESNGTGISAQQTGFATPNSNYGADIKNGNFQNADRFAKNGQMPEKSLYTSVDWKYTLSGCDGASVVEQPITSESLVHELVTHAKANNLVLTVHQHIHHHYVPAPKYQLEQSTYYLEPETQISRFQHFNYLPPLTEVPKLTSLAPLPRQADILNLLNEKELPRLKNGLSNKPSSHRILPNWSLEEEEEGLDFWETMRNLSQAQQDQTFAKGSVIPPNNNNNRNNTNTNNNNGNGNITINRMMSEGIKVERSPAPGTQKPVLQHHPLHNEGTPNPRLDDEFEDYELAYNTQSREYDASELIEAGTFGMIPFNPS